MDDTILAKRLLEYLRETTNNNKIRYTNQPTKLANQPETKVYSLQLKNAPKHLTNKQVLRLYPKYGSPKKPQMEKTLHNYLADNNFPAPIIHYACEDPNILGEPFTIMDHIPGEELTNYGKDVGKILAQTAVKLHNINPKPLWKQLTSKGVPESLFTELGYREEYVISNNFEWLEPAVKWLKDNRPTPEYVICHGDIHASNMMMLDGKVSGVYDWGMFMIDDSCREIGSTMVLYSDLINHYMPDRGHVWEKRVKNFLYWYEKERSFDHGKLDYFRAIRYFGEMTERGGRARNHRTDGIIEMVCKRFNEITGTEISSIKESNR